VFDLVSMAPFFERVDPHKYKIIPSILLLKSLGMVRYIERNLKHVCIPRTLVQRIQAAADKGLECLHVTQELIAALKADGFSGVQITTLGREDRLSALLSVQGSGTG
jgi:methylenetetrahydrofolate reductase (NADPH)